MSKSVQQVLALSFAIAVTTACATKGYVNEGLAEVNEKVEGCIAPGFLDSGLTVFAPTLPRPAV